MQRYTNYVYLYLYLKTALHILGGTHHYQERIQLYLQHLVFVTSLLLPAAIVEELNLVWVCSAVHSTLKPIPNLPRWQQVAATMWQMPDAVDTVACSPDDGWVYHPQHVQQFPDINQLCNIASFWIYSKTCLKRNLKGPEHFSAKARFPFNQGILHTV